MQHSNQYNFRFLQSANKLSTQNATKLTIFNSKIKIVGEGHRPIPTVKRSGEKAVKHSKQYNFRLLLSAKLAPRMRQNATF